MDEQYNDFGPRVGFAYDFLGNGRTVFRGGYGIYYPSIFFRHWNGNVDLFSRTRTSYPAPSREDAAFRFSDGFPFPYVESPGASAGPAGRLGQSVLLRESDPTTPLTQQWNASIQHQVGSWLFDVTYAGNKGNHFAAGGYNLNQLDPAVQAQYGQALNDRVPNPNAGLVPGGLGARTVQRTVLLRAFPHYSSVSIQNPRLGNYLSHQLQINIERRMQNGLMLLFAFTGGKKMGDSTQVPVNWNTEQNDRNGYQNGLHDRQAQKSIDPGDIARRATISLLYELPFFRGSSSSPLSKLFGGWQISSIGIMQTGFPLTITGARNQGTADRPDSTGESAKLNNPTRERWFNTEAFVNPSDFTLGNVGRTLPDVRTPGTFNFDLSLMKTTYVSEKAFVQFRVDAFNVFNSVNLRGPNTGFSAGPDGFNASARFGTITGARDPRRVQLSLRFEF